MRDFFFIDPIYLMSFPRKRESRHYSIDWIPAYAGMTEGARGRSCQSISR